MCEGKQQQIGQSQYLIQQNCYSTHRNTILAATLKSYRLRLKSPSTFDVFTYYHACPHSNILWLLCCLVGLLGNTVWWLLISTFQTSIKWTWKKMHVCLGGGGKMNISFDVIAMHAAEEFIWSSRLNIGIPQVANMQCLFFFYFFFPAE